jgi:hypothetical protein
MTYQWVLEKQRMAKLAVCNLIPMSQDMYAELQYIEGITYLHLYIPDDDYGRRILEGERMFWAWWKNEWHQRDELFLSKAKELTVSERIDWYMELHTAAILVKEIHPHSVALGTTYARMIGELHDSKLL